MPLVERRDVNDEALRQKLGVVVPSRDPSPLHLGSKTDAGGRRYPGRLGTVNERDESQSPSGTLSEAPETITVQCIDARPIELSLVNMPHPHRANKQYHSFIHFDRHLGAGWSTVFASSKSNVVVKFAVVPKKDKAELIRQPSNEKLAYNKLSRITGWVVPHLYGEYEWYGGRALVLSKEGRSLSLIERLILFAEVYCMHYLGVEHRDLEPQNVLRKRWSYIFKIIDFGFSDVDHKCPGWRECGELREVWHNLQLDRVNFRFGLDHRLFLLSMIVFPLLAFAFVMTSGIPANWRL